MVGSASARVVGRSDPTRVEAVGVGRGLAVGEVGAVSVSADAAGHSGFFDRLADRHAVLLELE